MNVYYFSATWCGPCKFMKPVFQKFSEEHKNINSIMIDVDSDKELTSKFQIRSVPTIVFEVDGKEVDRVLGLNTITKLTEIVQKQFKNKL